MPAIIVFAAVLLVFWLADGRAAGRTGAMAGAAIAVVTLVLLAGNRFNGADWINYKHAFDTLASTPGAVDAMVDSPFEWLFSLLLWAVGQAGLPYEATVFVIGVFNTWALLRVLRAMGVDSPGRTMALLMMIEGWTLFHEQLRQSVAVSLCLLAMLGALRGHWGSAALLWVAAMGFHSSAVIAVGWLPLARQVQRNANRPVSLVWAVLLGILAFGVISGGLALVRDGLLPLPGIDRLKNKLELYEEHDVFGGALFTAGMLGYAVGFVLLMATRRIVLERREFWLSTSYSFAVLWAVLGPLLRTEAILIRFEHYLLIFLPLAFGLLYARPAAVSPAALPAAPATPPRPRPSFVLSGLIVIFAVTFPLRVFVNPENVVWSLDYQNDLVFPALGLELEDDTVRETLVCANLALFDNDFCGREPGS